MAFKATTWTDEKIKTLVKIVAMAETAHEGAEVASKEIGLSVRACEQKYSALKLAGKLKKYLAPEVAALVPDSKPAGGGHPGKARIQWTEAELAELMEMVSNAQSSSKGISLAMKKWSDRKGTVVQRYYEVKRAGGVKEYLAANPVKEATQQGKRSYSGGWTDDDIRTVVQTITGAKSISTGALKASRKFRNRTKAACEIKYHEIKKAGRLAEYGGIDTGTNAPAQKVGGMTRWTDEEKAILVRCYEEADKPNIAYKRCEMLTGRAAVPSQQQIYLIKQRKEYDMYLKMSEGISMDTPIHKDYGTVPAIKKSFGAMPNIVKQRTDNVTLDAVHTILGALNVTGYAIKKKKFVIYFQ